MSGNTEDIMPDLSSEFAETEELTDIIQGLVNRLRGPDGRSRSRERSIAVTKLEEASLWLNAELARIVQETPHGKKE